jgi:hypothetical protein
MAKWCFQLGIVRRVEVIADDEDEIIEAVRRMSGRYDFVVTRYVNIYDGRANRLTQNHSGGIGPTWATQTFLSLYSHQLTNAI